MVYKFLWSVIHAHSINSYGDLRFTSFSVRTRWHVFRRWNHTSLHGTSVSYYEQSIHTPASVPLKNLNHTSLHAAFMNPRVNNMDSVVVGDAENQREKNITHKKLSFKID